MVPFCFLSLLFYMGPLVCISPYTSNRSSLNDGATPLFVVASQNGHVEVVRLLCDGGAAKDQAMNDGATPLSMASYKGHAEVVNLLPDAGVA